ncbi:MAG: Xaa-Pro peptidase family protein [Arenicella sp.]|nr:Xaa-Pro peptidase family protein [Arenicella sp.]
MFEGKAIQISHERPLIATPELQQNLLRAAQYRKQQLSKELQKQDCDAILLYNPINIRYATDSTNMQVWTLHNYERYALVFADGHTILWDFTGCDHLTEGNAQIDEHRVSVCWSLFSAGGRTPERAEIWARELDEVLRARTGGAARLAVDINIHRGNALLLNHGHNLVDGEDLIGHARLVKSEDELALLRHTIKVAEKGMWRMREKLEPGMTENEIWAHLHYENIKNGGEWIETRLLASGPRTNPWMQESSNRVMHEGELLSFDTDLIGPFGYCADLSRCWTVGATPPTTEQKQLYSLAYEQIHQNIGLLKAGLSYRECSERAWQIPDLYYKNRYCCVAHGVGMADEYPSVAHAGEDWGKSGYDGVFEAGMVMSVESYIGAEGGSQGVKLEQQVVITEQGCEPLTDFPFEESWLG